MEPEFIPYRRHAQKESIAVKLHTVIASVRPTRIGPTIGRWFNDYAVKHGKFDAELVDLKAFNLPVHDEPEHPRAGNYVHEHTKTWSKSVAAADAFALMRRIGGNQTRRNAPEAQVNHDGTHRH